MICHLGIAPSCLYINFFVLLPIMAFLTYLTAIKRIPGSDDSRLATASSGVIIVQRKMLRNMRNYESSSSRERNTINKQNATTHLKKIFTPKFSLENQT
jgi:hypothetical protein